jgi:hypothetical protein
MPGDPHPNGFGHDLMARAIYPVLAAEGPSATSAIVRD